MKKIFFIIAWVAFLWMFLSWMNVVTTNCNPAANMAAWNFFQIVF